MKVRGGFRKPRQAIKPVALHPRRSASRFFPQTLAPLLKGDFRVDRFV